MCTLCEGKNVFAFPVGVSGFKPFQPEMDCLRYPARHCARLADVVKMTQ